MMEYYLFIRPEELSHVRLRDISIKDQSVYVSAEVSKNNWDGKVVQDIVILLKEVTLIGREMTNTQVAKNFGISAS